MRFPDKKLFFKSKSVLLAWLFSYTSILLIPIIICGIVYSMAVKIIEKEINTSRMALLKHVQKEIDTQMETVEKLRSDISLNVRINTFIKTMNRDSDSYHYSMIDILKDLKSYKTAGIIKGFYIYAYDSNVVLKPDGIGDPALLFEEIRGETGISFEEWNKLLKGTHLRDFAILDSDTMNGSTQNTIIYFQSLPLENPRSPNAILLVRLDEALFYNTLQKIEPENRSAILIVDKNNRVVASIGRKDSYRKFDYGSLNKKEGLMYDRLDGESVVISYAASDVHGWKYVVVTPLKVFLEKAKYIKSLMMFGVLLCLLIGGLGICLFSLKNYNPLKELLNVLLNKTGVEYGKEVAKYNEFSFINKVISNTIDENCKMTEMLDKQKGILRSYYLANFLKGKLSSELMVEEVFDYYGIKFSSTEFAVLLFFVEDFSGLFEVDSSTPAEEQFKLVKFILSNISEELAGQNNTCFTFEIDEMMACLINFHTIDQDKNREELERVSRELQSIVLEKFYIVTTISVSDIHNTSYGITDAYMEAMEAMQYKMLAGSGKVIFFSSIKGAQSSYDYAIETEQQIINSIKAGDFNKAREVINAVFEKNFINKKLSVKIAQCLMFDLIGTVIKALESVNNGIENEFFDKLDPVRRLADCSTVEEMKDQLLTILDEICEYKDRSKKSHNSKLSDNIINYIESCYCDVNLSISLIADEFDANPAYLSRFFREQMGQSFSDYVNYVRIKKAKLLTEKSALSINEIAAKVGYCNSNAFIRAFKKYEGITPGQYKKIERQT